MGGGGSKEADVEMSKIFGVRLRDILKRMQKAVLHEHCTDSQSYS